MHLNEYQSACERTAIYKGVNTFDGVVYNSLKLAGEAGEIADKVGKLYGKGAFPTLEQIEELKKEAGDVLWHLSRLAHDLGLTLEDVGQTNLDKLDSRKQRGMLMSGNGDNR